MTQIEKIAQLLKKKWFIASYAILVILTYIYIDKPLAEYLHQFQLRTNMPILCLLTASGQWIIYVVLFFVSALFFRYIKVNRNYEAKSWYLLGCILLASLVCFVLKVTLSRARPDLLFTQNQFGFYWFKLNKFYWSFPSGHTMTIVSLAAGLGVLFPRYFYVFLGLALIVAVTRILLCYHYVSDVLSAFYISLLVVGCFTEWLKTKKLSL